MSPQQGNNDLASQLSRHLFLYCVSVCFPSIRSPGQVTPRDVECEGLNITYTRIAEGDSSITGMTVPSINTENGIDRKVNDAIEIFLQSLTQIGPELLSVSNNIIVSFDSEDGWTIKISLK